MAQTPGGIIQSVLVAAVLLLINGSVTIAQESKNFAKKGITELGGSFSIQSLSMVNNGVTENSTTLLSIAPFIGYFVDDGFELGLNPLGINSITGSGESVTQIMILAAPSYNFKTEGIAYPFIEALIGYTIETDGSSLSGVSWGGRGGVKLAVTGKCLLNIAIQYEEISENPNGATNRYGVNQFSISAGFSVWL